MKIYLIVDGKYPTIHKDIEEAKEYRNNNFSKQTAMYCEFKQKDLKEGFCDCQFKKI